ncbi:MAG: SufE family protein [Cyclobacteriaceae bacterium]|jgi:cysteine desulfuration protein SufE|nr:SufE family protein [Cyclobacteriaceae bacterium]MDB4742074.1 SufE family protein [Cyclobacteriaceae bacterium]|tara:strand:- start:1952 stop:2380 length:429 start_codon:yes stop_codon:yes gene_type:complete
MNIKVRQEEIIEEFGLLDGDLEMSINYLIELGDQLAPFPKNNKNDDFIVKGCQSKVWLFAQEEDQRVIFHADSNTVVTKGLVSLLVRVLSGHRAEEILNEDIYFPDKIGMGRFIGSQRSNGFSAMIKQMKLYALAINIKDKK